MNGLRPITALPFRKTARAKLSGAMPVFRIVRPSELLVEAEYQRSLSEKSMRLIARMIEHWDWCSMKPPVCAARADGKLSVIDGQHTAIAAISHGGIEKIPVMIVDAMTLRERARAFVRHNVDRVQLTHVQIYRAMIAAGDDVAIAVSEACKKAGVIVRASNPSCGVWGKNETVAIVSLLSIAERKGVNGLARVLKVLTAARRSPLTALEIRAVSEVLFRNELKGISDFDLVTAIRRRPIDSWAQFAKDRGKKKGLPAFKSLAAWWAKGGGE